MRAIRLFIIFLSGALSTFSAQSDAHAGDADLARLFQERDVVGTIVISSLDGKTSYTYNLPRAQQGFLPASTFKIPNTLIALKEGVIAEGKEIIKWDGKDKGWSEWNKDQSLESAFPLSCVWFYQELAGKIGNKRYLKNLRKIRYGNQLTGRNVTTFWLEGDLRINALEQIEFLKRMYKGDLPFKPEHIALLKKLMIVEENSQYVIRAKTGWTVRVAPAIGWYVGYVEVDGKVWFFATNLDIVRKGDERYRQEISLEALGVKGIIPAQSGGKEASLIRYCTRTSFEVKLDQYMRGIVAAQPVDR